MTTDIIQHASISGELSHNLWGRTDFEKYDSAWARAQNWTVDYRGGLFTRAGFEFGDIIEWTPNQVVRFIEFQFSPDTANTYVCVFTNLKVRFIQDNAYVLQTSKTVTGVTVDAIIGSRLIFTSIAHGYLNGDMVKLSDFTSESLGFLEGRTGFVSGKTNDTFRLLDPMTNFDFIKKAGALTEVGAVSRVYTITSPYSESELTRLQAVQIRDYVRLTHPNHPIKNLIRHTEKNWTIEDEVIGRAVSVPGNLSTAARSHQELDAFVYHVTAVSKTGEESLPRIHIVTDGPNLMWENSRYITITWNRTTTALYYNIYRSREVPASANAYSDMVVGYVGQSVGNIFTDSGVVPDFSKQPPLENNPFANGRIEYVTITNGGSGYTYTNAINWPIGGTGAYGFVITDGTGSSTIRGIRVLNGGKNYSSDVVTVSGGTGASMTATRSSLSGNNPHCCALFQQRMVYGATDSFPLRLFGSRPGFLSNFDVGFISSDADAYELDLDTDKVSPIRHILPVRGGLLTFNEIGVWLVSGRSGAVLNPNNAQSELQNATGSGYVRPAYVDSYIMYVTGSGQEIRMLAYDDYSKVFGDNNVSLLSNHLFSPDLAINSLTYCPVPYKTIYATQANGRLLCMTIDNANSVYGCTPNWTRGYFRECLSINENGTSKLYVAVERLIQGKKVMFFERQHEREFDQLEEACCADSCLKLGFTLPTADIQPSSSTGAVTFTVRSGSAVFAADSVGKIVRVGDGKALIQSRAADSKSATGVWQRNLTEVVPETTTLPIYVSGGWTMNSPVTTINGLWHLEGEAVSALADGEVVEDLIVTGGRVTLTTPASRVSIGLGYTCIGQTLPPTTNDIPIEGRRKDTVGVALRIHESTGLKYGTRLDKLYEVADRTRKLGWSTVPALRDTILYEIVNSGWEYDNQLYFVQDKPLPASILAVIRDMEVGDDKG